MEFLDILIESLINQTAPFDEIVVFDNSDAQNLRELSKFGNNSSLKWICSGGGLHVLDSFDSAVKSASHPYVIMFGDDDVASTIFCEEARKVLDRADFGVLPFNGIDITGKVISPSPVMARPRPDMSAKEFRHKMLRKELGWPMPGVVFKKEKYLKVGGMTSSGLPIHYCSDDLLWLKLTAIETNVAFGSRISWSFRTHSDRSRHVDMKLYASGYHNFIKLMTSSLLRLGVEATDILPVGYSEKRLYIQLLAHTFYAVIKQRGFNPFDYAPNIYYCIKGLKSFSDTMIWTFLVAKILGKRMNYKISYALNDK